VVFNSESRAGVGGYCFRDFRDAGAIRVYEDFADCVAHIDEIKRADAENRSVAPALLFRLDLNALYAINGHSRFWKRHYEHSFLE
jgi:hypothetical protein